MFRNRIRIAAGAQLRFTQRVILLLRFPDDNSGAALHRFGGLKRRCEHAAGTADERFQPDRCEHLPDVPQQRLEVFALLTREVNKLRVEPAAFEQAEAPKQLFRLHRAAVAAYHRQITGYAVAPKLALRRGI